jgi:hypothetical protein
MKLFSYIVARDYGFAPNPFHGYCTLATCKPKIRAAAAVGDWVVGTGAKTKYGVSGHLIYAMRISETMTYDDYWNDPRFLCKRPVLNGSLKLVYGDNIYHCRRGEWSQADSHHSLQDGLPNPRNIARDTSVDRVLISNRFVYWGDASPEIPLRFRPFCASKENLCCPGQGHRVLSEALAVAFAEWIEDAGKWGVQGLPLEFHRHQRGVAPELAVSRPVRRRIGKVGTPRSAGRRRPR